MLRPDTLLITPDLLGFVARIDEFKGGWRVSPRLRTETLASLGDRAFVESVASATRLSGASITDLQVDAVLRRVQGADRRVEPSLFDPDHEMPGAEVAVGYGRALQHVYSAHRTLPFTVDTLQQIVALLVGGDADRHAPPQRRPQGDARLQELMTWSNDALASERWHPLLVAAVVSVVLPDIRPYSDGNHRLTRVVTALLLLRAGYSYLPHCALERVMEERWGEVNLGFRHTIGTVRTAVPIWQPWVTAFLAALHEHTSRLEEIIARENTGMAPLSPLAEVIVDYVREYGRITIADAVKATGVSRNTLKPHFRTLSARGVLLQQGAGRGAWYVAGVTEQGGRYATP
jgi:hypothetical protein